MRLLPLTGQFRQTYAYSNFPYTEGALAAAKQSGKAWEELAEQRLFRPAGMLSTSYRYSDYQNRENKAAIHVFVNEQPVPRYQRVADAEAPAGGASSNVHDMARWLRLQLANGSLDGDSIVARQALSETHTPQILRTPSTTDYSKLTPPLPIRAQPLSEYVGTYRNAYYGTVEITDNNGLLQMRLPARGQLYALQPWDTDKFVYRFEVENGIGTRGVQFRYEGTSALNIENLALEGSALFSKDNQ
jgi:CubicO group peptidase (beta-lactamase class C family)